MPYKDTEVRRRKQREWVAANRDRMNAHKQNLRARNKAFLDEVKRVPCADCGERYHPCVMDFDHLPGFEKSEDVGRLGNAGVTIERLKDEIAKCEIVCANCHRYRTFVTRAVPLS